MSNEGKFLNQENIIKKVFDKDEEALRVTGSISVSPTPGAATEAAQDEQTAVLESIDTKLDGPIPVTTTLNLPATYAVVPLIDTGVTPISNVTYMTLVASTTEVTKRIQSLEDIGEFMGIYTGPAASEVLLCILPLGGGEVDVDVPVATRLSIRALGTAPVTTGKIGFNLLS